MLGLSVAMHVSVFAASRSWDGGGAAAGVSMSTGTSSEEAMLRGASDVRSLGSSAARGLARERRHWRARAVPSMRLPCWSSMGVAAAIRMNTTTWRRLLSNVLACYIVYAVAKHSDG